MNYHIVRTNETIGAIALTYNFSIDEIKSINNHIRTWEKLIPGTKLRLPEIPEMLNNELTDVEPFIEDYYPKINFDINKPVEDEEITEPVSVVHDKEEIEENKKSDAKIKTNNFQQAHPNYPYYPYGYAYPVYPYQYYSYPNYQRVYYNNRNQNVKRPSK